MRHAVIGRTKIVATIGPASRAPRVLHQLLEAGVNTFRLNFSHGAHEEHSAVVSDIRSLGRERGRHVAILQDLCGPKMRLNPLPGDVVDCNLEDEFTLVADPTSSLERELSCTYRALPNDVKVGETILFADGTVAMIVIDTAPDRARLKVTLPGRLRSRQGINLPGSKLSVSSLTDKDLQDLDWTARHAGDVDFVGLSFVRTAEDIAQLRRELKSRNCPAHVVAKIEKPQAIENLEEIVAEADAVMVARGDLGVEMDVQRVPALQKRIIALCNRSHRPVITATQMLNSMEHSSRPTRAEASDVFNAVVDGADAVMLSGETAVGQYPVETVTTMRQICTEAEGHLKSAGGHAALEVSPLSGFVEPITKASVDAACLMAEQLDATLIVVAPGAGARTALGLSNRRPAASILALSRTEQVARSFSLCWGVVAVVVPETLPAETLLARGVEWARSQGIVASGEHAVLLSSNVADRAGVWALLAGPIM